MRVVGEAGRAPKERVREGGLEAEEAGILSLVRVNVKVSGL